MLRLVALCFAAEDPAALARFWATALRWDVGPAAVDGIDLVPTDGTRFTVRFVADPVEQVGQERMHLDLTTSSPTDQEATVAQLLEGGGRHLDVGQGAEERHVVLADPEGNPLCVIEPENRFLGDCGRLGAINGDGTQAVGRFWSRALGWPLVWDQDEETAIRAPEGDGPLLSWGGPPVAPKLGRNRLHLELAPASGASLAQAVAELVGLGATRNGDGGDDGVPMLDPDGNELWVRRG